MKGKNANKQTVKKGLVWNWSKKLASAKVRILIKVVQIMKLFKAWKSGDYVFNTWAGLDAGKLFLTYTEDEKKRVQYFKNELNFIDFGDCFQYVLKIKMFFWVKALI